MELYKPVDFFRDTRPICLPQSSDGTPSGLVRDNYDFDVADIAGFGLTGTESSSSPLPGGRLRAVTTKIWPEYFCKHVIENANSIFERKLEGTQCLPRKFAAWYARKFWKSI